jgi:O-antigen ligase
MKNIASDSRMIAGRGPVATYGKWPLILAVFFAVVPFAVSGQATAEGSILRQIIWSLIFALAVVTLIRSGRGCLVAVRSVNPWFWVLLGYAALSILWSPVPGVSLRRFIQVVGIMSVALASVTPGYLSGRSFDLIRLAATFILLVSIVLVAVFPGWATHMDGAWRGMAMHKNYFGELAILCAIAWMFGLRGHPTMKAYSCIIVPLALVSLWFSRSATVILLLPVAGGALVLFGMQRAVRCGWGPVLIGAVLIVVAAIYFSGVIFGFPTPLQALSWVAGLMGRDATLTGRTDLWGLVWGEVLRHPWFGTGYGGFWLGTEGRSGILTSRLNWGPTQSHNGYLDVLNELGAVGLGIVLIFLLSYGWRLYRLFRLERAASYPYIVLFLVMIFFNFSETSLLRTTRLSWVVFVVAMVEVDYLLQAKRQRRRQEAPPAEFGVRAVA